MKIYIWNNNLFPYHSSIILGFHLFLYNYLFLHNIHFLFFVLPENYNIFIYIFQSFFQLQINNKQKLNLKKAIKINGMLKYKIIFNKFYITFK
jgi:hypothetical protein